MRQSVAMNKSVQYGQSGVNGQIAVLHVEEENSQGLGNAFYPRKGLLGAMEYQNSHANVKKSLVQCGHLGLTGQSVQQLVEEAQDSR